MEERLQKLLSAAGVCSRRAAEDYLTAGRVTVNGETARLGQKADLDRDEILVDGAPLKGPEKWVYLMLNKPRGYVTTLSDEQGRPTVAELTADAGVRVYPVGRLDLDSEGLLLLTNDGSLTARLLHPSHEVDKTYRVQVYGPVAGAAKKLAAIRKNSRALSYGAYQKATIMNRNFSFIREHEGERIIVAINIEDHDCTIRVEEAEGTDLLTGQVRNLNDIYLPPFTASIYRRN